ncbi:putative transmembrane protein 161AB [Phytophthora infestans]|uniref:Putative transmembrane protein 161AB n=1 Tax=Phytophthora infestans TaxID=4787 RepID=A0A833T1M1_PHYIN|nr:putative transmembrane protein 161AB [Phytophthora infestans]
MWHTPLVAATDVSTTVPVVAPLSSLGVNTPRRIHSMALFPPEFLAGILLAFVQLRLRSHFSLATWLVNGLTFFLPPEDELIATLNGQQLAKGGKSGKTPAGQPLSAAEKMDKFYVRVAKTEPGVFSQTLFFELYEMLVVLVSSASVACWIGSVVSFTAPWFSPVADDADDKVDVATYGLMSAMLVALWFPLQLNFAQGLAGYEARLGLAVGFIGLILSGFIILSPKGMFDFDLELAAQLAGQRMEMVLRAVGFVDADFVNIELLAELARISLFFTFALLAGIFTCTTFLPSFRFARMYSEMIKDKQTSAVMKLFLHLNMLFPVLISALWVPRLSSNVLVPSELVKCSPRALARDCLQSDVLGLANTSSDVWKWYSLTESQFHTLRIYVVFVACLVRLICFRTHLQYFLLEPREVMASLVGRPGLVDGALLQNKVRLQFNYVPIIALQYLAPVCALLASAQLLIKQTAISLGVSKATSWALQRVANVSPPAGLASDAATLNILPDPTAPPNLGGFRLGDELTKENVTPFLRGMGQFPILTAEFYDAALGFLIWFLSFTMFAVSLAGLIYWRNVAAHGTEVEQPVVRPNKQTPKTLKNQLKSLKLKKNK